VSRRVCVGFPLTALSAESAFDTTKLYTAELGRPVLARSLEGASVKAAAIPPAGGLLVSDNRDSAAGWCSVAALV
jgi:hypothetical protein